MSIIKERLRKFNKFLSNKKYLLGFVVLMGILIVLVGSSFATLTPVSSITVPSTTLSYSDKAEGSWQYTKSAHWISKDKAQINIKVDTLEKNNADYTDIVLMLDLADFSKSALTYLKSELSDFVNENVLKGNKISIIGFSDLAVIMSDFTDNSEILLETINNISSESNAGSSYYQALIKLDELLSTYSEESNRNCVAVLFTDGQPTLDIPSEVGEYRYLKNKYDYLNINGVQYNSGDTAFSGIKNVTDEQFFVIKTTIYDTLIKASLTTDLYEKLVLTDYVDDNYFNLDNITDITTTFGEATISNNKVIWDLSGLRSGLDASLTIDINLNNDLEDVGGVYSTHSQTDVNYKIDKTSTTETTTQSTVLKDSYLINYEANAPASCVPSNVPGSKKYFVYDTVQIDSNVPTCSGYQFKGWEIITSGVEKVTDTTFVMPEQNVTLRAIWEKLNITKSMDGTVVKVPTLYDLIAGNSIGLDTNVDFSSNPTDANSGIYTRKGTESDQYPVYYYRGNVDNNNVYFAGFCWKAVRTTNTGGVKLIYNGTPEEIYESIPIAQNEYINVSNDTTYPYTYDSSTNKWTSTNKTDSATGTISFSVAEKGTYILSYSVSSEANYDKAYFYKDGTEIGIDSGTNTGTITLGDLTSSNVIMVKYTKDVSSSSGTDTVSFSVTRPTGATSKKCDNTDVESQIGTSEFSALYRSVLNGFGYMYGENKYYINWTQAYKSVLTRDFMGSNSYYFGTSVTYSNGKYTLNNAVQRMWSDYYSSLSGYYTCGLTSNNGCSKVYYIAGGDSTYRYAIPLTSGDTSPTSKTITLGRSVTENSDGTFTLKNTVTVRRTSWFSNYDSYNGYYFCKDFSSTTCDSKNLITSTDNYQLVYDDTYKYLFGNDVTWDGSKYTLKDTFTSTNLWDTDKATIATKYHYTCFNTTGQCEQIYYLIDFDGEYRYADYLILDDGENIETAKEDMFSNVESSDIKQLIDSWYAENMTSYTAKLEDTLWCNDRTLYSGSIVGKDFDAGTEEPYLYFGTHNRIAVTYSPSVVCPNSKRDGFTVSTDTGGNGALTYPVGLLTADEIMLAGGNANPNSNYYLYTGQGYFSLSPDSYFLGRGIYGVSSKGALASGGGVRPAVSLAPGIRTSRGDGSTNNPYVIDGAE